MTMTTVFAAFALMSALAAWLLPHLAYGLGPDMLLIYLGLAVVTALLQLVRLRRRR